MNHPKKKYCPYEYGFTLWILCAITILTGCATTPPPMPATPEVSTFILSEDLVLRAGDSLRIEFPYTPEMDSGQYIRPDGYITPKLIGEVQAAGKTPAELRNELIELYASTLKDPEITVSVVELASHVVYVSGEVLQPGLIKMPGRPLTALEAVMNAGGFNKRSAKRREVVVVRLANGKQVAQSFDLRSALEEPLSEPFFLEPYDIVYVPRTRIDQIDQWIDQHINEIIPRNVYFTFTRGLGNLYEDDGDTRTTGTTIAL